MSTLQTALISRLEPRFSWAGFTFPRYVARLPQGPMAKRLAAARQRVCGEYFHAPKPITHGSHPGRGFYLEGDNAAGLRYQWAFEVIRLRHTGWYYNDFGDFIRGFVAALPHGRGWLAGWSMGVGMASELDGYIYSTPEEAAYAADRLAEQAAEAQRDYEAEELAEHDDDEESEPEEDTRPAGYWPSIWRSQP